MKNQAFLISKDNPSEDKRDNQEWSVEEEKLAEAIAHLLIEQIEKSKEKNKSPPGSK